jgi:hypothetical protein
MYFVKLRDPISRVRIGASLDNNHIFEKEALSRRINDP